MCGWLFTEKMKPFEFYLENINKIKKKKKKKNKKIDEKIQ